MHPLNEYDLIIFDCDGVIFDSNNLKIDAMGRALEKQGVDKNELAQCLNFFAENFGKSRFFHIDYFIENFISTAGLNITSFKESVLALFSKECFSLYAKANLAPNLLEFLKNNNAKKYIASGSEQEELRKVIYSRGLSDFFRDILGSPTKKVDLVAKILDSERPQKALMIGDAVSDLQAAKDNSIDFVFFSPYSNVGADMLELCERYSYRVLDSFDGVPA